MTPITFLDACAGIGGFSLGFLKAGFKFKTHYFSETDRYAESIYKRQFPGAISLGRIEKISNNLGRINILTGGFPCQPFSISGKRGGFEDSRGIIIFELLRLAKIYQPDYMVLENVKGLSSHEGGDTIRQIISEITRLGFFVQLLLVNTIDFGIPQNRERWCFICTFRRKSRPEISTLRSRLGKVTKGNQISNCIDANYYKGVDNAGQRTLLKKTIVAIDINGPSRCLRSSTGWSADKKHNFNVINHNSIYRRLTPIECERLQGFPDNWTKYGCKGEIISDTQRYKRTGNAVTVNWIKEVGIAIKKTYKEVISWN